MENNHHEEKAAALAEATATGQATPESEASPTTESSRALAWRKRLKLSRKQLAALTGYSTTHIAIMESDNATSHKPPRPTSWQRYRLACATAELGLEFNWTELKLGQVLTGYEISLKRQETDVKHQDLKSLSAPSLQPWAKIIDEVPVPVFERFSELEPQSAQGLEPPAPEAD